MGWLARVVGVAALAALGCGPSLVTDDEEGGDPRDGEDWCAGAATQESCEANAPRDVDDTTEECHWIDTSHVSYDDANDECIIAAPVPVCLTIRRGGNLGCSAIPCSVGHSATLGDAVARTLDGGVLEVFGVTDEFCDGSWPVGDWLPADDPAIGRCAYKCG